MPRIFKAMLCVMALFIMAHELAAIAQTTTTSAQSPNPVTQEAAPATPAQVWKVGPFDVSGYIDGYYSFNDNHPTNTANGQENDGYNFDDKTNQFDLNVVKLTVNRDSRPVGAHFEFLIGRTNTILQKVASEDGSDPLKYMEQAYISVKPAQARGFEADFGKFTSSAGAEVTESRANWNYSRSLLFVYAVPYFHFGVRTTMPVSKSETVGLQVVNGWNNIADTNGGVTVGLTSALTRTKYTWSANYYVGSSNANTASGKRNLFDTTLLLMPNGKLNAYINYDYGQNRDAMVGTSGDTQLNHWQGVAFAAHYQLTGKHALAGRAEYFSDPQGFASGSAQRLKEFTGTYEYKLPLGVVTRAEYRRDSSDVAFFHKGNNAFVDAQTTVTVGLMVNIAPWHK